MKYGVELLVWVAVAFWYFSDRPKTKNMRTLMKGMAILFVAPILVKIWVMGVAGIME